MAILLATKDGARFLTPQLESLETQTWPKIDIYASDDSSIDETWEILNRLALTWRKGTVRLLRGPSLGNPAENFRSLMLRLDQPADFVAFCDQDDIWLPQKLELAISAIGRTGTPTLHCSRTKLIEERAETIGMSTYFPHPPGFRNALVQSLAGGNTMVMNWSAFRIVRESCGRTSFPLHDWWTYLIVSGAGGKIIYSPTPDTKYRQHPLNALGSNLGLAARLRRLGYVFAGQWRSWNERNLAALMACHEMLTGEAKISLALFVEARRGSLWHRLAHLRKSAVYRQTWGAQLMLYVACICDLL